jgi:hypothetical protein
VDDSPGRYPPGYGHGAYAELATGTPSPVESLLDKAPVAAINAAFCADVPETDPASSPGSSSTASIGSWTSRRVAGLTRT